MIGTADDFEDANGGSVLNFWQAQDKARVIASVGRDGAGGSTRPATVREALDRYESDLKTRGGDTGNVFRVRVHLTEALSGRSVALLTARDLRSWRDALIKVLAPATVNRTCAAFKAALNLSADHDEHIANRRAWETGLAFIPDAEQSRNIILPESAVRDLIAAAQAHSAQFGLLVEVAATTGARVSQLSRLEVQDLQCDRSDPRLMMPTSRKGKGTKKIMRRPVPIPVGLAARLGEAAAGRSPNAPLLLKPSGAPWKKSDHSRLFSRTVKRIDLDPGEVTIYALRHSNIVRQILAGVPIRVVAVNHDTSIAMLERTYSRYIGDHSDALARSALLDIGQSSDANIITLRA